MRKKNLKTTSHEDVQMKRGKIFVVSAPSGAGKTTLLDHVRRTVPNIVYSISATTRRPRAHEKDGEHYFFLSEDEFKEKIAAGELAEWQKVHGHYYGTPKAFVKDTVERGTHVVMDLDVYGKTQFQNAFPDATGIFVTPPSMEELQRRLRERGTDHEESIGVRLENARHELDYARRHGNYDYEIVNDDLEQAKRRIVEIMVHEISSG